jgi:adenosylmethionine---8-amino-7-oxononanoate aminotransferase
MNTLSLEQRDKKVIWHPITQHGLGVNFPAVRCAEGAWLELEDGTRLLDAVSSWWVNIHGHAHPVIANAIASQANQFEQLLFGNFTHEPAVRLAEHLIEAVNKGGAELSRCFYSDNGSTAVEVALKMAFQFYKNRGEKNRTRFIALEGSYHGDTLGAMAVTGRDHLHQHFVELFPEVDYVKPGDVAHLETLLSKTPNQYAAMIVEPLIQGASGMQIYARDFLQQVADLCKKSNTLLIVDEIFTGFYRTGTCFAFSQASIKPDFICLAKGITGGFLPLSVTLTSEEVYNAFLSSNVLDAFLHGHSYTANPVACAAGLASWDLLQQVSTQLSIKRIVEKTKQWIEKLAKHPKAKDARCLGTIGAVDIRNFGDYFSGRSRHVTEEAMKHGVFFRPLGSVIYALPPYCVTDDEIDHIYQTMENLLSNMS